MSTPPYRERYVYVDGEIDGLRNEQAPITAEQARRLLGEGWVERYNPPHPESIGYFDVKPEYMQMARDRDGVFAEFDWEDE